MDDGMCVTIREQAIHNAAQRVLTPNWKAGVGVSKATKNAHGIGFLWQTEIMLLQRMDGIRPEYKVAGVGERFDLVDTVERTVYELKSSANNPSHEFYKDVFKVWVHNQNAPEDAFTKFIFLVPRDGAEKLNRGLGWQVITRSYKLGFQVLVWDVSEPIYGRSV